MKNWGHMNESLTGKKDTFEGLEWRNVLVLLSVLRESNYTRKDHIKRRYSSYASHFRETLAFAASLGAIREEDGHVRALKLFRTSDEARIHAWFIVRIFKRQSRYRTRIFRYLRLFDIADGRPKFSPPPESRHKDSHVRNFLMELGIVSYDSKNDTYQILLEYFDPYALAHDSANMQKPEALTSANRSRESLGLAAEKTAVLFEQGRLGSKFADRVKHVAIQNASAGYDIRSVTIDESDAIIPRYIEVKAVSISSFQFHWTRNEVRMAKQLAEWYYLYLIPVKSDGHFIIDEIKMISNPHSAVLQTPYTWVVEADVLLCCLR